MEPLFAQEFQQIHKPYSIQQMDIGLYYSLQRYASSQWSKSSGLTRLRLVSSQQILSSVMTNILVY